MTKRRPAPRIDMNKIAASVVARYTDQPGAQAVHPRAWIKRAIIDILSAKETASTYDDLRSKQADRILDLFDVRHDRPLR